MLSTVFSDPKVLEKLMKMGPIGKPVINSYRQRKRSLSQGPLRRRKNHKSKRVIQASKVNRKEKRKLNKHAVNEANSTKNISDKYEDINNLVDNFSANLSMSEGSKKRQNKATRKSRSKQINYIEKYQILPVFQEFLNFPSIPIHSENDILLMVLKQFELLGIKKVGDNTMGLFLNASARKIFKKDLIRVDEIIGTLLQYGYIKKVYIDPSTNDLFNSTLNKDASFNNYIAQNPAPANTPRPKKAPQKSPLPSPTVDPMKKDITMTEVNQLKKVLADPDVAKLMSESDLTVEGLINMIKNSTKLTQVNTQVL